MEAKIDKAIETAKGIIPSTKAPADLQKAAQAVLNLASAKSCYAGIVKPTKDMDDELSFVLGRVRSNVAATEMQQITQAALHLIQAKVCSDNIPSTQKKPGATST